MKTKSFPLLKFLLAVFSAILLSINLAGDVVPSLVNFRGKLSDAQGNPVTGSVAVTVNVFNQESGGNVVYSEGIGAVQVKNGLYAFRFGGSGQPDLASVLRSSPQAWLEVSVDGAALSRQRLVSVPYALVAKSVGEGGVADVNGVLSLQPQSGTPTAVSGKVVLFAKPDGKIYYQDLNGTETVIGGGSGGGTPGAGAVTLDMLAPEVKVKLNATSDSNGTAGFPSTLGQKVWGKRYGGSGDDRCYSVVQASDGGYLLVGMSNSNADGDKSESGLIGWDYWAVKVDAAGNKIWDKRYGGSGDDLCYDVVATTDGGYLLAGYSASGAEGDKTESSRGSWDYWVVKIDADGTKLWDKRFGGTAGDTCTSIIATSDGGYLLSGRSSSGIGGDKTEDTRGNNDYWVVKIDANGGKLWDKRFGGPEWDNCYGVTTTADGGYLLSGLSASGIGGDKTEDTRGNNDYWVVKIDTSGNKIWDKRFGGAADDNLASITTTPDGGYLLVGLSDSDVGGDKTEVTRGNNDYWVVKIDASGNKVWDKRFGGSSPDRCRNVFATADGGYLLVGLSASGSDGDKSEIGRGDHDYWVVKIDASGNKIWDKRLGGNGTDSCYDVIATKDGDFLLAGFSNSELSGDQSESPRGNYDYWIVKIRGNNFVSGSVGNPAVGAVTLDMLSPEVKARLNPPSPAPLGATLANPYGWGGTPVLGGNYTVPVGKVLVITSSEHFCRANGSGEAFRKAGSAPSVLATGTSITFGNWAGILVEPIAGIEPITAGNYTVPAEKTLVICSSEMEVQANGSGFRQYESPPSIIPSGTNITSSSQWSGYLKDN